MSSEACNGYQRWTLTESAIVAGRNKEDFRQRRQPGRACVVAGAAGLLMGTSSAQALRSIACPVSPQVRRRVWSRVRGVSLERLAAAAGVIVPGDRALGRRSQLAVVSAFGILTSWARDVACRA